MKNQLIYFMGERVRLTGYSFKLYGGDFYEGVYLTGHNRTKLVMIDYAHINRYYPKIKLEIKK